MMYRISYGFGLSISTGAQRSKGATQTEYFPAEYEALRRARELLDGDYHAVSLCDSSDRVVVAFPYS